MYYPEQNLQMPVMNYQYPLSEGPMGLTYMPIENLPLSRTLLMDETPESSGLQNGHAAVTSAPLTQPATPLAHRSPVQSIARSSRNKYFLTAVTPVHIPPFSRPATHSDTTSLPLKRRTDVCVNLFPAGHSPSKMIYYSLVHRKESNVQERNPTLLLSFDQN